MASRALVAHEPAPLVHPSAGPDGPGPLMYYELLGAQRASRLRAFATSCRLPSWRAPPCWRLGPLMLMSGTCSPDHQLGRSALARRCTAFSSACDLLAAIGPATTSCRLLSWSAPPRWSLGLLSPLGWPCSPNHRLKRRWRTVARRQRPLCGRVGDFHDRHRLREALLAQRSADM